MLRARNKPRIGVHQIMHTWHCFSRRVLPVPLEILHFAPCFISHPVHSRPTPPFFVCKLEIGSGQRLWGRQPGMASHVWLLTGESYFVLIWTKASPQVHSGMIFRIPNRWRFVQCKAPILSGKATRLGAILITALLDYMLAAPESRRSCYSVAQVTRYEPS